MALFINQQSQLAGKGKWDWAVWIEGPDEELGQIERVAWFLHESFPDPLRWRSDRSNGFRLEESSWGSFEIVAKVYDEHEQPVRLSAFLDLEGATEKSTPRDQRTVFVSYSLHDERVARQLRSSLEDHGVKAYLATDDTPGEKWESALHDALTSVDAVVLLVGPNMSPWMGEEARRAKDSETPVIPVLVRGAENIEELTDLQSITIGDPENPQASFAELAATLKSLPSRSV